MQPFNPAQDPEPDDTANVPQPNQPQNPDVDIIGPDDVTDTDEDDDPLQHIGDLITDGTAIAYPDQITPPTAGGFGPPPPAATVMADQPLMAAAGSRLAHNLDVRRQTVYRCWPGTVVYYLGDAQHQARLSDHNRDARGIIHAIDIMCTGAHAAAAVREALAHHQDLEYIIHAGQIWTAPTWQPHHYTGINPHTDHVHLSGKHGTVGRDAQTGTGYDTAAEQATPVFAICGAQPQPAPRPTPAPGPRPTPHRPGRRVLRLTQPRMTGEDVRLVQQFIGPRQCGAADGIYGPRTVAGVRWYQRMRRITVDGIVGPVTWGQMGLH